MGLFFKGNKSKFFCLGRAKQIAKIVFQHKLNDKVTINFKFMRKHLFKVNFPCLLYLQGENMSSFERIILPIGTKQKKWLDKVEAFWHSR